MHSRYPNFQGSYTETAAELTQAGEKTGCLIIGCYGPYSLDDDELSLINLLNRTLLIIAAAFTLIACAAAALDTSRITRPITAAIGVAPRIAQGNYTSAGHVNAATRKSASSYPPSTPCRKNWKPKNSKNGR
jgi:methyl-accepting chemotaxis protein